MDKKTIKQILKNYFKKDSIISSSSDLNDFIFALKEANK